MPVTSSSGDYFRHNQSEMMAGEINGTMMVRVTPSAEALKKQ